jgi:antitoxin component YwqK of YwqJK toxin-antitoxin module
MKVRHLIPLVLGLVGCEPPDPVDYSDLVLQGVTVLDPATMKPYSGPVFSLHEGTNDVSARGRLADGLREGPWEYFDEAGLLREKKSFSKGAPDGLSEEYDVDGQLRSRTSYSNGERDGLSERFHSNGQLSARVSYSNGEQDGPLETFHLNGQLSTRLSYSNGGRDSLEEAYDEDGRLLFRRAYSNDEPCGEWSEQGETVTYPPCPSG